MGYDANQTQLAKATTISEIVAGTSKLLEKCSVRTNLYDTAVVKQVASEYLNSCSDIGVIPSMEGLAASLGVSRRWLYQFLTDHSDEESAKFLEQFRTTSTAIRIAAADRGAADATISIFLLLNSSMGYTNDHRIELVQQTNPLDVMDIEAARRRYLDELPQEDET